MSKPESRLTLLSELEHLLRQRKTDLPEGSYTSTLFKKGLDTIVQKVGEESVEVIIAAKNRDREETVYESADLIYHLLVMLVESDIPLDEVLAELEKRRS